MQEVDILKKLNGEKPSLWLQSIASNVEKYQDTRENVKSWSEVPPEWYFESKHPNFYKVSKDFCHHV